MLNTNTKNKYYTDARLDMFSTLVGLELSEYEDFKITAERSLQTFVGLQVLYLQNVVMN